MTYEPVNIKDKARFDALAAHPLQSWQWGAFREKTGTKVIRNGYFEKNKLTSAYQMTIHPVPKLPFSVGYIPKGSMPTPQLIASIREIGQKEKLIFAKFEPRIIQSEEATMQLNKLGLINGRQLFTKYTFYLDLKKSEDELLKDMHSKTRYNIRVAQKHGVTVQEESSPEAFEAYLRLTKETTTRQGFYAHTEKYHRLMWETLGPDAKEDQIAHLFTARYQDKILAAWVLFLFNDVLYYPYGASSGEHREVMASTAMLWETARWGKKMGASVYDLWGTPGPNPTPQDPYYGFHRFKMGFAPNLIEFVGTYDLILKNPHYHLFTAVDSLRWKFLKLKARF